MRSTLLKTFPDLSTPNPDSWLRACDVLIHANAPRGLVREALNGSVSLNADVSRVKSVFEEAARGDPGWMGLGLAQVRLELHGNRPVNALRMLDRLRLDASGLRGLCYVKSDVGVALGLLGKGEDEVAVINVAALMRSVKGAEEADAAWANAAKKFPENPAALNGAKMYAKTLDLSAVGLLTPEFEARTAQALVSLAVEAKNQQQAVTAEGLLRTAVAKLKSNSVVKSQKSIYALEHARALDEYGQLLLKWDFREKEGQGKIDEAKRGLGSTSCLFPSFSFYLPGWEISEAEDDSS